MTGIVLAALLAAADCHANPAAPECSLRPQETSNVDRAKLEDIYSRPEFSRARLRNQGTLEQLWRRFWLWFESFFGSRGAASYSSVIRFLVLLAAALVAGWAVLKLLSRRTDARRTARAGSPEPAGLALEEPAAHLGRAHGLLAVDPRAALREGLLGLLSLLERQRLARPDRVKTNRELARELPSRGAAPELTQAVEQLLGWYDRTFYSLDPVQAADAARFLDDVEKLA